MLIDKGLNGLTLVKIPDATEVDKKYVLLVTNLPSSFCPNQNHWDQVMCFLMICSMWDTGGLES